MRSRWGSVGKDGDNNQDNRGTGNSTNIFTYSSLLNNVHLNSMGPLTDFFFPSRNKVLYHLQFVESSQEHRTTDKEGHCKGILRFLTSGNVSTLNHCCLRVNFISLIHPQRRLLGDWLYLHHVHRSVQSVQFSHSVASDSLWPHGLQHARPPCPSPTPRVYSNSCPLSWWCQQTISSSVIPFFRLQSFPASGSFQMSQLFASSGQSIGVSASTSVFPMNIQDWFPFMIMNTEVFLCTQTLFIAYEYMCSYAQNRCLIIGFSFKFFDLNIEYFRKTVLLF